MDGNLTKGPILKTLTKLAIPIMASYFIGTLYNITDMAWIGQLGSKAVAGVGVGGMFTWLSQGLSSIARMGGQVQVAQCIGRGDREKAHGYAQVAIQLAFYMGLIFALISLIFVHQMVGFFNLTDPEAYSAAVSYTRIACGLIVFSFLTVTLTGLYTAQGDSQTPFWANLIGLATNMILDPILILGPGPFPKLGVIGAAIATVTAQFIVMGIMVLGIQLIAVSKAAYPPCISGLTMIFPTIQWIPPQLPVRCKAIWRTSCHCGWQIFLIQLEQFRIRPGICAVISYIDRNIPNNLHSILMCIFFQSVPLLQKYELNVFIKFNFII